MDLKSVLILGLYLACYYPTSYLALKYFGVRDGLKNRALVFGATIGSLQFVLLDRGTAVELTPLLGDSQLIWTSAEPLMFKPAPLVR